MHFGTDLAHVLLTGTAAKHQPILTWHVTDLDQTLTAQSTHSPINPVQVQWIHVPTH